MSLVQYPSSDDDSDVECAPIISKPQEAKPIITANASASNINSISSFLPPPKSSIVHKSKGINLGGGAKNTLNDSIAVNPDGIVLPPSKIKVTSLVPSSLRGKKHATETEKKPSETSKIQINPLLGLNLFQEIKTKSKLIAGDTKIEIQKFQKPIITKKDPVEPNADGTTEDSSKGKKRKAGKEIPENIKEFNVSEFYTQNIALKEQGLLKENKSLHTVTHQKNQLTALMKNAKQDEELLKERHEYNKRARKERQNQHGW